MTEDDWAKRRQELAQDGDPDAGVLETFEEFEMLRGYWAISQRGQSPEANTLAIQFDQQLAVPLDTPDMTEDQAKENDRKRNAIESSQNRLLTKGLIVQPGSGGYRPTPSGEQVLRKFLVRL